MPYSDEQLSAIYDRTSGYCHLCHKKLSFNNYGTVGTKGAWEVEHSRPKANGGSNRANNLYPACVSCNRSKGTVSSRAVQTWSGRTRAPLSREKRKGEKRKNAVAGGIIGGLIGSIAGPLGAVAGAAIGAKLGHDADPDN